MSQPEQNEKKNVFGNLRERMKNRGKANEAAPTPAAPVNPFEDDLDPNQSLSYDESKRKVLEPKLAALGFSLPANPADPEFAQLIGNLRRADPALAVQVQGMVKNDILDQDDEFMRETAAEANRGAAVKDAVRNVLYVPNDQGEMVLNRNIIFGALALTALGLFSLANIQPGGGTKEASASAAATQQDTGVRVQNADGSTTVTYANGDVATEQADGTVVLRKASGDIVTTAPDGTVTTDYTDGRQLVTLPDGSSEERSTTGAVTMRDPQGNVTGTRPPVTVAENVAAKDVVSGNEEQVTITEPAKTVSGPQVAPTKQTNPQILTSEQVNGTTDPADPLDPATTASGQASGQTPQTPEVSSAAPPYTPDYTAQSTPNYGYSKEPEDETGNYNDGQVQLSYADPTQTTQTTPSSPQSTTPASTGVSAAQPTYSTAAPTTTATAPQTSRQSSSSDNRSGSAAYTPNLPSYSASTGTSSGTAGEAQPNVVYQPATPSVSSVTGPSTAGTNTPQTAATYTAPLPQASTQPSAQRGGLTVIGAASSSAGSSANGSSNGGSSGSSASGGSGQAYVYRAQQAQTPRTTRPAQSSTRGNQRSGVYRPGGSGQQGGTGTAQPDPAASEAASETGRSSGTKVLQASQTIDGYQYESFSFPPNGTAPTPTQSTGQSTNAPISSAPVVTAPSPYKVGQRMAARMETGIIIATQQGSSDATPVFAKTADGTIWLSDGATLNSAKRMRIVFTRAILPDGTVVAVNAQAYTRSGNPGLEPTYQGNSPTLGNDLVRAAVSGVSEYVDAKLQATRTTNTQFSQTVERQAPTLWESVAGNTARLFRLPQENVTFVTTAYIQQGEQFVIVNGQVTQ